MFTSNTLNENEIYALRHFHGQLEDILSGERLPSFPDLRKVDLSELTDAVDRSGLRSLSARRLIDIERTIVEDDRGEPVIASEFARLNPANVDALIDRASKYVLGTPPSAPEVFVKKVEIPVSEPQLPYLVHLCTAPNNNALENRYRAFLGDPPMEGRIEVTPVAKLSIKGVISRVVTFGSAITGTVLGGTFLSEVATLGTVYHADFANVLPVGIGGVAALWGGAKLARSQVVDGVANPISRPHSDCSERA